MQTNGRGRNAFYKTPEELQAAVDEYFESIKGVPVFDKDGLPVTKRNGEQLQAGETPPTLSGLAYFCGYKDRRTFSRQAKRGAGFRDVVDVARLRCEEYYERALYNRDTYNGATFMLSMCFGWKKPRPGEQEPGGVRVVTKTPRKKSNTATPGGDPAIMQSTNVELLH